MPRYQYGRGGVSKLVAGIAAAILALLPVGAQAQDDPAAAVGTNAPAFKLVGSDGKQYSLAQFKGEKPVVLAFFPKSFTPG